MARKALKKTEKVDEEVGRRRRLRTWEKKKGEIDRNS